MACVTIDAVLGKSVANTDKFLITEAKTSHRTLIFRPEVL
jgi:hypothetical protein